MATVAVNAAREADAPIVSALVKSESQTQIVFRRFRKHPGGGFTRERRFSDASWSGEQPCMVQRTPLPGRGELLNGVILTDDHASRSTRLSRSR